MRSYLSGYQKGRHSSTLCYVIKFFVDNTKKKQDIHSISKIISHFTISVDNEANDYNVNHCHFTSLGDNMVLPYIILCHYRGFNIMTSSGLKLFKM